MGHESLAILWEEGAVISAVQILNWLALRGLAEWTKQEKKRVLWGGRGRP